MKKIKSKPKQDKREAQAVATYFLAKHSGLFQPGQSTILANSPMTAKIIKPKLKSMDDIRFPRGKSSGGGGQSGLPFVDLPKGPPPPAWVPTGAKIYIDFMNNRAWDGGVVAISTLLGNDPNIDNAWGTTGYNPANLTADGYVSPTNAVSLALIGDARTKVLDKATIVTKVKMLATYDEITIAALSVSTDGLQFSKRSNLTYVTSYSWNGNFNTVINNCFDNTVGALNKIALTWTANRADMAANGSLAMAGVLEDLDRPAANPYVGVLFDGYGPKTAFQYITIYDALPDTTGLSELTMLP